MKRFALLVMAAAIVGFAGQAYAGVALSAHDVIADITSLTNYGVCSSCHIPHKSQGDRLWPAPATGFDTSRGSVGALCSYCHDATSGVIGRAAQDQVFKDTAGSTHGLAKGALPGSDALDANLPYTNTEAGSFIQCTTCHNVHDQSQPGRNAFLQDDIDILCARCHASRQFTGGSFQAVEGPWGARFGYDPAGTAGNPGSHPVGTDILSDADANSPVLANGDASVLGINITPYGAQGDYNLGAKLIGGGTPADAATFTGGIGCVTCHAVHGGDNSADGAGGGTVEFNPNPDVLALNQSEMGTAANGNLDPNDALCEACHRNTTNRLSATYYPNPGATAGTHPVDDYYNLADAGVTKATITALGWPQGDGVENGDDADIICESCHMPHPLAASNGAQVTPPVAAENSHILRDIDPAICDHCHTTTLLNHHPIGTGLMDGTLFRDDLIGDADADLECADCHNGSGAHNWTAAGAVGLDPDWEPTDHARGAQDAVGLAVLNMSKECADCHYATDGASPTRFSPTRKVGS